MGSISRWARSCRIDGADETGKPDVVGFRILIIVREQEVGVLRFGSDRDDMGKWRSYLEFQSIRLDSGIAGNLVKK